MPATPWLPEGGSARPAEVAETTASAAAGPAGPRRRPRRRPGILGEGGLSEPHPHPGPSLGVPAVLLWGRGFELPGGSKLALPWRKSGPVPRPKWIISVTAHRPKP